MTEAEVMERLGPLTWKDIQAQAVGGRRSGRTWRMLVAAVATASRGQTVLIEAHSDYYAQELRFRAREWCSRCGVDPEMILMARPAWSRPSVLVDHFSGRDIPETRPGRDIPETKPLALKPWTLLLVTVDMPVGIVSPSDCQWQVYGPRWSFPELDSLARPMVPPCPCCPKTISEHRQAAPYDISTNHSGRVCVEMDKLLEKGLSEEVAWESVRNSIWIWDSGRMSRPRPLRSVDLEWASWKLAHEDLRPAASLDSISGMVPEPARRRREKTPERVSELDDLRRRAREQERAVRKSRRPGR